MKLLVIDTATEACSAALSIDGKVSSMFELCPQQHSQRILPMVEQLLNEAGVSIQQLDYLGFGRGPGSFTGVRIATGILQGLALGTELPVVGVSTLAAMAQQAITLHDADSVAVAIDARMEEVYFGCFTNVDGIAKLHTEEAVLNPENTLLQLDNQIQHIAGTGWDAYPQLSAYCQTPPEILYPDARYMLPLALEMIADELATDIENVQPVYLRDKVTWKKLPGR